MARSRVSEEHFVVSYDGPALAEHQMDVADLARSLLALSAAFKQAQRVIQPEIPPVTLHATATSAGSFEVALSLMQPGGILDVAVDLLAGRHATATVNASGLVGIVGAAVVGVKKLAGRKIVKARPRDGAVVVTTKDGDTVTFNDEKVFQVVANLDFRQQLSDAFAPLDEDGVEVVEMRGITAEPIVVSKAERRYFTPPEAEPEELETVTRDVTLQVVGVEFDWHKWRFTEGAGNFHADIEDLSFRNRVERQEIVLGASDLLKVRLRTRQYRDRNGALKTSNAIEEVLQHIPGGRQLAFDFEAEPDDES